MGKKEKKEHDILLWKAFRKGKKWALSVIFSENYDDLFLYGFKSLKDKELTRDLIQDLFLKIWKNRRNLNSTNNIKAYLLKGLRMLIIDHNRGTMIKIADAEPKEEELEFELSIEDIIISNNQKQEQTEKIFEAIDKISSRQKEAIYLKYLKGYEYHEISTIMNINTQSVRNLVHNGLNAIREKFQEYSEKKQS